MTAPRLRTIIAGGRDITDEALVRRAIKAAPWKVSEVVSGGARGVDAIGEALARRYGVSVRVFPADWGANGKAAGPMRNAQMAEYAEALIAVWDGKSRGTAHMIDTATARGLRVHVERAP